jgi:hypothetical protein
MFAVFFQRAWSDLRRPQRRVTGARCEGPRKRKTISSNVQ